LSALHGKIANVEVTSASGEPGASSYIRIRGANSITGGTQPLFVVDGSPVSNEQFFSDGRLGHDGVSEMSRASDLNPEDIESMEILKGPAASAIYGSRAANGVVLVSTKKGKPGRVAMSYKMSYSWDDVNKTQPLQTIGDRVWTGNRFPECPGAGAPSWIRMCPFLIMKMRCSRPGMCSKTIFPSQAANDKTTYYCPWEL